jgi:hypothetical protein
MNDPNLFDGRRLACSAILRDFDFEFFEILRSSFRFVFVSRFRAIDRSSRIDRAPEPCVPSSSGTIPLGGARAR